MSAAAFGRNGSRSWTIAASSLPSPQSPDTSATWWRRLGRPIQLLVCIAIVAGLVAIYDGASSLIGHIFNVLLLFVFASILALILTPVVDAGQRLPWLRVHRGVTVVALYLVVLAAIGGALALVSPHVADQAHRVPALLNQLQQNLSTHGIHVDLTSLLPATVTGALNILASVTTLIADVVLVVVISIYLLIDGRGLVATLRNIFPNHTRAFDFATTATGATMAAYVRGQLLMSLIIGTYTALTLSLIGVHYAILIGVAAFVLEFVPVIGAVIALALGVAIALLQSPLLAVFAGLVGLVGHLLEAYVIGPRVAGHVTKLHPMVAMAALLVGAEVAGVLGALFAVPLAALANIFLGALYRSRQGEVAMTTSKDGTVDADSLPRLGEEISAVEDDGVAADPVPHGDPVDATGGSRRK